MFFYLTRQHTTRIVRSVMKHMLTITGEILTVLLIFALGFLLLAL
jgi:chromosome condensin MukBEF MukE localization factor